MSVIPDPKQVWVGPLCGEEEIEATMEIVEECGPSDKTRCRST